MIHVIVVGLMVIKENTIPHNNSGQLQDNRQGGAKYGQGHKRSNIYQSQQPYHE